MRRSGPVGLGGTLRLVLERATNPLTQREQTGANVMVLTMLPSSSISPVSAAAVLHQTFATVAPPVTPQTTATPHTNPGRPEIGNYQLTTDNGTLCFLASMGLQLNMTLDSTSPNQTLQEIMNIQPNRTKSSGICHPSRALLTLTTDVENINLTFVFTLNTTTNNYHLSEVSLLATLTEKKEPFVAQNLSLDYLQGTLGFSYMCRNKQALGVTPKFTINTFQVQVQPFGVTGKQFGAAEECQLDEDDMMIPVVVGAALAVLVLIVLSAYLIGRKRSHAGYQSI